MNRAISGKGSLWKAFKKQSTLQLFVILGMVFLFIFNYVPMFGILMGFKHYSISTGISGIFTSKWAGFDHFIEFFRDYRFRELVRNTLAISILKVIFSFPIPILLALMINEIQNKPIKRFVQTATYLPHFVTWITVLGISNAFLSDRGGVINQVLMTLHLIREPIAFLTDPGQFWGLAVFTAVWKESGWWTIIFLSAIAGIDPTQYEAAELDGAGRLQRIWYITLPSIKDSVVTVLILTVGSLLGGGLVGSNFEQSYLLGNIVNNPTSEIVQTYAFKVGLVNGRFDYATAITLVQSLLSVILVFGTNYIARKTTDTGLF